MKKILITLLTTTVLAACGTPSSDESSLNEVQAEDLWAGDATYNSERYVRDNNPCYGERSLNDTTPTFDGWDRQRAGYTNVCFQVWKPGATDQENPDFWRELDVQMHYRWVGGNGEWKKQFVNAHDRVGNNRRYIWDQREKDPFSYLRSDSSIPITVISEYPDHGQIFGEATLEFYFTVNGHGLGKRSGTPYQIKYQGYKYFNR